MRFLTTAILAVGLLASALAASAPSTRVVLPKYVCGGQAPTGTYSVILDHFSNMTATVTPGSGGQSLTTGRVSYSEALPTSYAPNSCSGEPCSPNLVDVRLPDAVVGVEGAQPILLGRGSSTMFGITGIARRDSPLVWAIGDQVDRQGSISTLTCCDTCHYVSVQDKACLAYTSVPTISSVTLASQADAEEWSTPEDYEMYDIVFSYPEFPWLVQLTYNGASYAGHFTPIAVDGQANTYVQHVILGLDDAGNNPGSRTLKMRVNCVQSAQVTF